MVGQSYIPTKYLNIFTETRFLYLFSMLEYSILGQVTQCLCKRVKTGVAKKYGIVRFDSSKFKSSFLCVLFYSALRVNATFSNFLPIRTCFLSSVIL
jgi:hypothetical protein